MELESELNVSFSLTCGDLAERSAQQHVRRIQNRMVEQIDEFRSELEPFVFADWEVLMHTQIHLGQRGSAGGAVVAVAEGVQVRHSEGPRSHPLDAGLGSGEVGLGIARRSPAVGSSKPKRAVAAGSGVIKEREARGHRVAA